MTSVAQRPSRSAAVRGKKAALPHGEASPALTPVGRKRAAAQMQGQEAGGVALRSYKAAVPGAAQESTTAASSGHEVDQFRLLRFLGFRLTRAKVQVHKQLLQRLDALELNATEYSILVLADANKGIYQRQLGTALEISPPNMVPIVERLVVRGLLRRVASEQDRRMQELHLTPAGQTLLAQAEAQVEQFEAMLEARLTATERRYITSALKKLGAWPLDEAQ